jgi:hypothetical protein
LEFFIGKKYGPSLSYKKWVSKSKEKGKKKKSVG